MAGLLNRRDGKNPNEQFEKLKQAAVKARLPFDKDMLLNIAFFLDYQYSEWFSEWNTIRSIPRHGAFKDAPRPVSNKIMHFVVQEHAYALSNRPTLDVLPATDDPLDVSLTSVALAYLKWLTDPTVSDFDSELSDAVMWALQAGEGYLKWTFDTKNKRPDITSVSPLDLYPDPFASKFKRCRYLVHSQFMDVQAIYDLYGIEVKPTTLDRADAAKAALMRDMGQSPVLEGAVVNELWLKPSTSRQYPKGLFTAWSGRTELAEKQDFPYQHGHMPFTQLGCIPLLKTPHYTCAVKYLRNPQMELNKYHQQKLMTRENFANLKWWVPEEVELEQDPDNSPAQILKGTSAGGQVKPEILEVPSMPDNHDGDWIRVEMADVVGLHEVSQAQVPGRVDSAKAIELLKESDDSRLAELLLTIKNATSEGGWQSLMLAKQFIPGETIVQTYSREGMPEVKRFKATELQPGMRVVVTMGTGLTKSRAARADVAVNMWQNGIITDPEVMAELLELPVGTIAPQRAFDIKLARNENMLMANGTPVKPNSWDAHDIHIREHNNHRKTAEYEGYSPDTKKKWEFHCQMHETMQLQQLAKEAQKQAVIQGLVAPPGEEGAEQQSAQSPQQNQPLEKPIGAEPAMPPSNDSV